MQRVKCSFKGGEILMRVASFDELDMINTDGIALTVYFQGCHFHCKGCHNPELQDFTGGTQYDFLDLEQEILRMYKKGDYDYVCLCGGEPLDQPHDYLRHLMTKLDHWGIKVWMYTGYDYDKVPQWAKRLCYCIKCGLYKPELGAGIKLASKNQCYYFKDGRREY